MSLKVYAPATCANLNVGFDVLGVALQPIDGSLLGDVVTIEEGSIDTPTPVLYVEGPFAHRLPHDPAKNLASVGWRRFNELLKEKGVKQRPLRLTLNKALPVGSGLGSSACSVVATLHGLNLSYGEPLTRGELLRLMGELEGSVSGAVHYDNVAPSYLGGLQLIMQEGAQLSGQLPCFDDWRWVLCNPGTSLSTAEARAVMPSHYPREDCLSYGRSLASFIHALHTQDHALATRLLRDVIAEPYRAPLLPALTRLRAYASEQPKLLATGISGAGPTLFALVHCEELAGRVASWMRANLIESEEGFTVVCSLDQRGARQIEGAP